MVNTNVLGFLLFYLQLSILGGSSLNLVGLYAQVIAHEAIGDNSGRITLRREQVYYSTQTRVVQEYSILAQRLSGVALPLVVNCRGVDVKLKGNFLAPDKYWKIIFFISHPKHVLWVLKRTVSMRRFF